VSQSGMSYVHIGFSIDELEIRSLLETARVYVCQLKVRDCFLTQQGSSVEYVRTFACTHRRFVFMFCT